MLIIILTPATIDFTEGILAYATFRKVRYVASNAVLDAATQIDELSSGLQGNYVIDEDAAGLVLRNSVVEGLGLALDWTAPYIEGPVQLYYEVVNSSSELEPVEAELAGIPFAVNESSVLLVIEYSKKFSDGRVDTYAIPAVSQARLLFEPEENLEEVEDD